jgi:topoisomerase-4 subunit B
MSNTYNADAIEVLSGLDPVRKRPGMYTDTTRPNHLVQEVIDNSVDEALAGHAKTLTLTLSKDGTVEVEDDGRGMPVDIHKAEGVSGVELILTKLHAGGKFSNSNYEYSGGLHGVGVSVVNALSKTLEVIVRRGGNVYSMSFADGYKASELEQIDTVGKAQYRHYREVRARRAIFRLPPRVDPKAETRAAGEGGSMLWAARELHRQHCCGR